MPNPKETQLEDDEIDLRLLLKKIWSGRKTIVLSIFLFLCIEGIFLTIQDFKYQAIGRINISSPEDHQEFLDKFISYFESSDNFVKWKKENKKSKVTYFDISGVYTNNGFEYKNQPSYSLLEVKKEQYVIRSRDRQLIDEIYSYLKHSETGFNIISKENKYDPSLLFTNKTNNMVLHTDIRQVIDLSSNNSSTITISRTSEPILVSPNIKLITILTILLGSISGLTLIILKPESEVN